MKKFKLLGLLLGSLIWNSSFAESSTQNFTPQFGLRRAQLVFGLDYEYMVQNNAGLGAFFLFSTEKESKGIPGFVSVGATAKLHIEVENLEVYAAPGVAVTMVDIGDDDDTIFGPVLKLGVQHHFAENVGFGVEYAKIFNWTGSDTPVESLEAALLNIRIGF